MDLNTNQLIAAGREHNFHFTSPSWTRSINYEQIFSVCSPWMARKTLFRAHLSPSVKPNQLTICRNGNYSQFATGSLPFVPSEESDSLNKLEYPERWCSSTVRKWEKKLQNGIIVPGTSPPKDGRVNFILQLKEMPDIVGRLEDVKKHSDENGFFFRSCFPSASE